MDLLICILIIVHFVVLQVSNVQPGSPVAEHPACGSGGDQLLPHAHLHDVQRVPVPGRGSGRGHRILPLLMEACRRGGYQRTLPLA
jgi:hypothetical protein